MPLSLAIAGLTPQESSILITVLRARSADLAEPWTVFFEPAEFPEKPDAILYCPKRDDGRYWFSQFAASSIPIAAMPPLEASPPEVPLFLRMPFRPQDTIDTLNLAAKRVRAQKISLEERPSASGAPTVETPMDLQIPAGGTGGASSLSLSLYAVFREADKLGFYKIRRSDHDGHPPCEIWCWPEFGLYWSSAPEETLVSDFDGIYQIWACPFPRKSLSEKSTEIRSSSALLWRVGNRAIRTSELLPWIPKDAPISLAYWPELPRDSWRLSNIRALARLSLGDATFAQLLAELQAGRKDLCKTLNGLALLGAIEPVSKTPVAKPAPLALEPEEAIFLKSLALHCSDSLDRAVLSLSSGSHS